MSSSGSKSWAVAASIGAVEALKDQGFCRWNYTFRSLNQHCKRNLRSLNSQANKVTASSRDTDRVTEEEEGLLMVMFLTSWGPY